MTIHNNLSHGGRNLLLLAIGSTLIALVTTGVSLIIYHTSGDIYLDRSRPGFLPDEDEGKKEQDRETRYVFSDSGPIDSEVIDEYLKEIKNSVNSLDQLSDPFSDDSLSNESLGITPPKAAQ